MRLLGYSDRISAAPGDRVRFMVSCEVDTYEATLVRLVQGDAAPAAPGFKEELVSGPPQGVYPGRFQQIHAGSYGRVPDAGLLHLRGSFTIQAWIYPTTPTKGAVQGLITKWARSDEAGYGLLISGDGDLELRVGVGQGTIERISMGTPLRPREWAYVACTFDATTGRATLHQEPLRRIPGDPEGWIERKTSIDSAPATAADLLFGAAWVEPTGAAAGLYNGKLEGPRLYGRALARPELEQLRNGTAPPAEALIAAWDFSREMSSNRIVDSGPYHLDGETIQMPTRAVTGHNWSGRELCFRHAPDEYGAIHFHDDDLEDAGWEPDLELDVGDLQSGVYAVRLQADGEDYHVPFIVRPPRGRAAAPLAVLLPTLTYSAYANERQIWHSEHLWAPPERLASPSPVELHLAEHRELGLSLYDLHSDGAGVCYSSRLRPIPNMGPRYRSWLTSAPRHLAADLYLLDWLEMKGYPYDVITDDDLNDEGVGLLAHYRTVVTGSHPEYWTERMLEALERYVDSSGRLMYLGGNGFYWVTSVDPRRPHVIEVRRGSSGTRSWEGQPGEGNHSMTGEPGGLWRHRGRSPNALTGVGFSAEGWDAGCGYARHPESFREDVAWIFDGVPTVGLIGDYGLALGAAAGDEIDRADKTLGTPPQTIVLASATELSDYYQLVIEDLPALMPGQGGGQTDRVRADMTYLERPGGGAVFSAGSITWTASLSHNAYVNDVSRITENVLRRFLAEGENSEA